jgi:hypothetical protein
MSKAAPTANSHDDAGRCHHYPSIGRRVIAAIIRIPIVIGSVSPIAVVAGITPVESDPKTDPVSITTAISIATAVSVTTPVSVAAVATAIRVTSAVGTRGSSRSAARESTPTSTAA